MRIEPDLRLFERHIESAIFWQPSRLRYPCARRCMVSMALFRPRSFADGMLRENGACGGGATGGGGCVGPAAGRSRVRRVGGTTERSRER